MKIDEDSWLGRHRKFVFIFLPIAAVLLAAVVVLFAPGLIVKPWSGLNTQTQELDLYSGRARYTRYFFYRQISREIRETPLSKAIARVSQPDSGEEWGMVNEFDGFDDHSPYCHYHTAFDSARRLEDLWDDYSCDANAQAKSGKQFLRAMRDDVDRFYLSLLRETLERISANTRVITAEKIPDDLVERAIAKRVAARTVTTTQKSNP